MAVQGDDLKPEPYGSVFGKRDLLAFFHVMKYDVKCGTCLHKFDCRDTTLQNANNLKIFLIELEICLYKHPGIFLEHIFKYQNDPRDKFRGAILTQ